MRGWLPVLLLCAAVTTAAHAAAPNEPDPALRAALVAAVNASDSFDNRYAAEVWLLDMSTRLAPLLDSPQKRLTLLRTVHREATRAGLRPELVLALIQVESRFARYAISPAGARGLMQVMPFWKKEIGRPQDNLFDVQTNLRYGCTILRYYLDQSGGNVTQALARYNGSFGKYWYPARVHAALSQRWYRR
ncbi:MAG: transglycosylase SLT domain-containing protein [Salinisphaera sp.]|nr:transglycosylase SLT domain-containing protein [Salinisphaera sp.]MDN5938888.1 transglycosylase SLT domain-containing protein [Salinisphaera sp.]